MGRNKIIYAGETLIDLTADTVTAETLAEGVTAHGANGEKIVGTMKSGGGVVPVAPKDVNFWDYDGTLLYSYTLSEARALTELPPLPTQPGLICQGWNWTLNEVTSLDSFADVGALYITDNGDTRLYTPISEFSPKTIPFFFSQTVANGVVIDWGDGKKETVNGTGNVNVSHTYAEIGEYVIAFSVSEGCTLTLGSNAPQNLFGVSGDDAYKYGSLLRKVEFGERVKCAPSTFRACLCLLSVSAPDGFGIEEAMFRACRQLKFVVVSKNSRFVAQCFYQCAALQKVAMPKSLPGVKSFGETFWQSSALRRFRFPEGTSSIIGAFFAYSESMREVFLPEGVTSVGYMTFYNAFSLGAITFPSTCTSLGSDSLYGVFSLKLLKFKGKTPPAAVNAKVFNYIPADCVVEVPAESLEAYKNATNYAPIAAQMVGV